MPGNFRVKFRTGRDHNDSEPQSSAGVPQHQKKVEPHREERWDVDSLDRKARFILRGLETSDDRWQLHRFLDDAFTILGPLLAFYCRSDVIRRDAEGLHCALVEQHDKLQRGSYPRNRAQLSIVTGELDKVSTKYARLYHAATTRSSSCQREQHSPDARRDTA